MPTAFRGQWVHRGWMASARSPSHGTPSRAGLVRRGLLYPRGIGGKLRFPAAITIATLGLLRDTAEIVVPAAVEPGSCRDASDGIVPGVAVAGRADGNVSGDKHLLTLGRFHSVRIVTPREFREAAQEG